MEDDVDRILAQWGRERPDVDPSPMGVIGRISRLARAYERAIGDVLATHGITADEFDVLATLRRAGEPFELTPTQLRGSMMVTSATVTHRIDKLERRDLVARRPDPDDRRGLLVALTPAGRALVDRAVTDHVANEHRLLGALPDADRRRLADLLRRLALDTCTAVERDPGVRPPG